MPEYLRTAHRVWDYADVSGGPDACWPWQRSIDRYGYGQLRDGDRIRGAHCVAYEEARGPIPEGLKLDHVCHNTDLSCLGGVNCRHRRCVNPSHLEPVEGRVNTLRGRTIAATHAAKSACAKGHPLALVAGGRWGRNGARRICATCRRFRNRASKKRLRATPEYRAKHAASMRVKRQAAR